MQTGEFGGAWRRHMLALCSDKPLYKQRTYLIDRQKKRATCADLFSNFFSDHPQEQRVIFTLTSNI